MQGIGLVVWLLAIGLCLWGTWLTVRHFKSSLRALELLKRKGGLRFQPISILKPVKGFDSELENCLLSFFDLDYPEYEILFSIADATDSARATIQTLISRHPQVRAQLLIGDIKVGANPKINNLVRGYRQARHDWILISDSNIKVSRSYLKSVATMFAAEGGENIGVVTAVVRGASMRGIGGWLEATFLNTFYARWMVLAKKCGTPIVIGKSMLFRRSQADRFGGLEVLSCYLAEDFMTGQAMRLLGRSIEIMSEPVVQPLGHHSFAAFWSRHLRWGRMRKSQAPLAFLLEPFLSLWLSGLVGAYVFHKQFGISFVAALSIHVLIWLLADLLMIRAMGARISLRTILAWFLREAVHIPLWVHISLGRSVVWRGSRLRLARGGVLQT